MEHHIQRIEHKLQELKKEVQEELQALGKSLKSEGVVEDYKISTSPIYDKNSKYKEEIIACFKFKGKKQKPCIRLTVSLNISSELIKRG